jgi:predicted amidohydrolase
MSTPPTDTLRLALWQTPLSPSGDGAQPGLPALNAAMASAAAQGAHWLVTPEMALTGYAIGAERVRALAETADGPLAEAVAALAQRHGVGVVYGFPEHNGEQRPFNSVQAISARGERLGLYRKTHLYGAVDAAQFNPGDSPPPVFDANGWRIGLLICYDVEFPEPARDLALRGADLVLVPTANMAEFPEVVQRLVPARACENRLFVAYANACGLEHTAAQTVHYGGLSTLCGPMGEVLTQAGDTPVLLLHTLQRSDLVAARQSSQLPLRRPGLYASLGAREDQKSV